VRGIAPPPQMHIHGPVISWINSVSLQWKLREMGEPHELTLDLLNNWELRYRTLVRICRFDFDFDWVKGERVPSHKATADIIDDIVGRLIAEYEWPKPTHPQVTTADIDNLWNCIHELDKCRESYIKY